VTGTAGSHEATPTATATPTSTPAAASAATQAGCRFPSDGAAPAPPRRPRCRGVAPRAPACPRPAPPTGSSSDEAPTQLDFAGGSRCPPLVRNGARDDGARDSLFEHAEPVLLTKEDAARRLSISVRQLSRYLADGSLTAVRLGPRLVRFTTHDLAAFVARQSRQAHPPSWPERPQRRRH